MYNIPESEGSPTLVNGQARRVRPTFLTKRHQQESANFRECMAFTRRNAAGQAEGIFGPTSLSWSVYREMALLAGGGRALLLQLAHPAVAEGVYQHSNFKEDPLGRAWRTSYAMNRMIFGDLPTAVKAAKRTFAIHTRVQGVIQPQTSARMAGLPYRANDPELRLWVYATLFDTALLVYEHLIRPLSSAQKERLYSEGKLLAALNGIPPWKMPPNFMEFRAYVREMLGGPTLEARETAKMLCAPLFRAPWAALRVDTILTAGFLPPRLRNAFGFRWTARKQRLFTRLLHVMQETIGRLPGVLRFAPAYHLALARIAQSQGKRPSKPMQMIQRLGDIINLPLI